MNNSLDRLLEGMIDSLRNNILPHTEGEFARGQAYGIIFLLESLRRRTAWSSAFLDEQIAALNALAGELGDLPDGAPKLVVITECSEAARDAGDARVAALIDWLAAHGAPVPAAVDAHLKRRIRHELTTSAPPMFAAISLGHE